MTGRSRWKGVHGNRVLRKERAGVASTTAEPEFVHVRRTEHRGFSAERPPRPADWPVRGGLRRAAFVAWRVRVTRPSFQLRCVCYRTDWCCMPYT